MTVAAGQRDLDAVRSGLEHWLRASRPDADGVHVAPLHRPASGYSSETLLVDVVWDERGIEREERLVARLPPAGGGIFPVYDLTRQARVQRALADAGIPVAAPVAVELDEEWVGAPFFVMRAVAGLVLPDSPPFITGGPLHEAEPQVQRRVQRDFVQLLADVHRLDWDAIGLGELTPPGARGAGHDVERAREYLEWAADGDPPTLLTDALDWCRERIPDPEPPLALVWGDPRLGNVVYDAGFGAAALLDWEMASIGPAELDLAWFLGLHSIMVDAIGADLPGFVAREEVLDDYAAAMGREVRGYPWFEVLSLVRSDSIFLRIRRMLLASGLDEPWLRGPTPVQQRVADLIS
jgi:aminoglycoside phosphotransferase (APT) family kinase protein